MGNPWMEHVAKVRKTPGNERMSFKDVLKLAKKSYSKVSSAISEKLIKPATGKTSPKKTQRRRRRPKNKGSRRRKRSRGRR
tara:strand:+ start:2728 stop:2970 length:243 start_codon:yes stop_codon:yes gene_type:complete